MKKLLIAILFFVAATQLEAVIEKDLKTQDTPNEDHAQFFKQQLECLDCTRSAMQPGIINSANRCILQPFLGVVVGGHRTYTEINTSAQFLRFCYEYCQLTSDEDKSALARDFEPKFIQMRKEIFALKTLINEDYR
jgi:hypothetical protein